MAATRKLSEKMVRAGMRYLEYLRIDCRIDLNSYLDEEILETLFFKMVAENLAEFDPRPSQGAPGCDLRRFQSSIHLKHHD